MSAAASSLSQVLAQHGDDDVLQAISLMLTLKPNLRGSLLATLQQQPGPRYSGTISNFLPEKGFGFISSEGVMAAYGKDAWVCDKELGHFKVGDAVHFSVVLNKEKKPQARLLQSATTGEMANPGVSQAPHSVGGGHWAPPAPNGEPASKVRRIVPTPTPPAAVYPGTAPAAPAGYDPNERYVGTISSFWPEKHFGFIQSEAAQAIFGKDTFLSDMEIGSCKVGDTVSFNIALNRTGQPQARAVRPEGSAGGADFGAAAIEDGTSLSLAGLEEFDMLLADLDPTATVVTTPVAAVEDGSRFTGVITTFSAERRFGFIQSAEAHALYSRDVYLSDHEIGPFSVGNHVSFRLVLNKDGKPQARELQPAQ